MDCDTYNGAVGVVMLSLLARVEKASDTSLSRAEQRELLEEVMDLEHELITYDPDCLEDCYFLPAQQLRSEMNMPPFDQIRAFLYRSSMDSQPRHFIRLMNTLEQDGFRIKEKHCRYIWETTSRGCILECDLQLGEEYTSTVGTQAGLLVSYATWLVVPQLLPFFHHLFPDMVRCIRATSFHLSQVHEKTEAHALLLFHATTVMVRVFSKVRSTRPIREKCDMDQYFDAMKMLQVAVPRNYQTCCTE